MGKREWTAEVWQSAYGHRARKRTWLYYAGDRRPWEARWWKGEATHQIGWFDKKGKKPLCDRAASSTPLSFARFLVFLAATSR